MREELQAFQIQCERMDWTYQMSDDFGVWQRGTLARAALHAELDRLTALGLGDEARVILEAAKQQCG